MKKFLLVTFIVAVIACVFAISIGAETVTYEGKEIELVNNLGDPSWYTADVASAINDKESIVILKDKEGNLKAYPSYYILRFSISKDKEGKITETFVLWADQKGVDYSFINEQTGTGYESGSVYYIEFPYGLTRCFDNSIFGRDNDSKPESNVVEIVIPDSVTVIDVQSFRRMNSCKKITISKNVVTIPNWAFCGSEKLETVVFKEGCLTTSIENSFSGCKALSSINLEACTNLKSIGSTFNGCTSLRKLALPDSLETIGDNAFYKIGEFELASDYLPKNLKTIGSQTGGASHFLSGCKLKNEVLYFPEGFTNFNCKYAFNDGFTPNTKLTLVFLGKMTHVEIGNVALTWFTSYGEKKALTIVFANNTYDELGGDFVQGLVYNDKDAYISKNGDGSAPYTTKTGTLVIGLSNNDPNSATQLGKDENGNNICDASTAPAKIIFCGGEKVEYCYSVRNNHTDKGWYRFFTSKFEYDMDAHSESNVHYVKRELVKEVNCGYDGIFRTTCVICDLVSDQITPATGNHTLAQDDFDCTTSQGCIVCLKEIVPACEKHSLIITIEYKNGFFESGIKKTKCECDGCKVMDDEQTVEKIFKWLGYSKSSVVGSFAIMNSFAVNHSALNEYNGVASEKIEAHGVIAGARANVTNGDVFASSKKVTADYTSKSFDIIEMKVGGLDNYTEAELYVTAYISVGGKKYYAENGAFVEYLTQAISHSQITA